MKEIPFVLREATPLAELSLAYLQLSNVCRALNELDEVEKQLKKYIK